ncbi:hypothetical protein [Mycobacterium ostraviense]|uniref:Lipoprotein n=1 Tax=Mycobacterium ostraviense TaxID=2738409 RepID=A0A163W5K8_9MYCO|nr:hypothetical protein [Mycobacterium ostraviense]KZS58019.1 hypothetical protein A4G28_05300 [Mycobacterium ostraviense]UGT92753.1 hypothetical protein LTS72_05135 [Mycobacterium ostraviense]
MPHAFRASAALVACAAAISLASPAGAEPGDQFPGDGVFLVGTDIAPGTYRTEGPSNPLILVFGRVSELSTCSWLMHGTPAASAEDIVNSNTSMGPMYVTIPATVAAFETRNCKLWMRVS